VSITRRRARAATRVSRGDARILRAVHARRAQSRIICATKLADELMQRCCVPAWWRPFVWPSTSRQQARWFGC
jgi:hypothetical protein